MLQRPKLVDSSAYKTFFLIKPKKQGYGRLSQNYGVNENSRLFTHLPTCFQLSGDSVPLELCTC
jgi:hypothetical protein